MEKLICVYGAASDTVENHYILATEALGEALAKAGWSLIYGGGGTGMMGAAARGMTRGGGRVIGVLPEFMTGYESLYPYCDETVVTETMSERKQIMEDRAEAFIIAPGGVGTMDEFFQVLTLKTLDRHAKPIVLYNIGGFYDQQIAFIDKGIQEGFISPACRSAFAVCDTPAAVLAALG